MIHVLPTPSGFMLNDQMQHSIVIRYACSKLSIDFDGFVACMIRLETLFSKCLYSPAMRNSCKLCGFIKYLVSFNCEYGKSHGNLSVPAKLRLLEQAEEKKQVFLSE